jgi:hypothetical protein
MREIGALFVTPHSARRGTLVPSTKPPRNLV